MEFLLVRVGKRPILAVPATQDRLPSRLFPLLPTTTWRSLGLSVLLRLLWTVGAGRLLTIRTATLPDPLGLTDWDGLLKLCSKQLGLGTLTGAIMFAQDQCRGRAYLHLFDARLHRVAFAKLAAERVSVRRLEQEAVTLEQLAERRWRNFRIPALLGILRHGGLTALLLAPLPKGARRLGHQALRLLDAARREWTGPTRQISDPTTLSWWPEYDGQARLVPELAAFLRVNAPSGLDVCCAHGDFTHWNSRRTGTRIWVFDWELFRDDAPVLADQVRFLLGLHTRRAIQHPALVAAYLEDEVRVSMRGTPLQLAYALAFLHSCGVREATRVASLWPPGRPLAW